MPIPPGGGEAGTIGEDEHVVALEPRLHLLDRSRLAIAERLMRRAWLQPSVGKAAGETPELRCHDTAARGLFYDAMATSSC